MKFRFVLPLLLLCSVFALADDKADLQAQLSTVQEKYAPLKDRLDVLEKKGGDIDFVKGAYAKQSAQYATEVDAFNAEQTSVDRGFQLLKPAVDNWQQRIASHNAHQCQEVNHDGSCNWYEQERISIDNQRDQINAVRNPLLARQGRLDQQKPYLDSTKEKLDTIRTQLGVDIDNYNKGMTQLRSDYEAVKAQEAAILAKLRVIEGSKNKCLQEIPAACQNPAVGPDGKPILDQNCERMKYVCSQMFDGN